MEKKEKGRNRKWRKKGERKKIRIKLDYWYQKGNIIFCFLVYEYLPWNVRKLPTKYIYILNQGNFLLFILKVREIFFFLKQMRNTYKGPRSTLSQMGRKLKSLGAFVPVLRAWGAKWIWDVKAQVLGAFEAKLKEKHLLCSYDQIIHKGLYYLQKNGYLCPLQYIQGRSLYLP